MSENKQRITKISKREKAAAAGEGWGMRIPAGEITKRLQNEPCEFTAPPIITMLQNRATYASLQSETLEPREIASQAAGTMDVINELLARLEWMHPDIEAEIDAAVLAQGDSVHSIRAKVEEHLQILHGALNDAQGQLISRSIKTGPKRNQWARARDDVTLCIQEHSSPRMRQRPAKALAEDLLDLCGLPSPRKQ